MLVLPVPLVFVLSIVMAFILDWAMGLILLGILIVISVIAVFIIKSSSPLFRKLQKLLDKMNLWKTAPYTGKFINLRRRRKTRYE